MTNLSRITALALVVAMVPAGHAFTAGCGSDASADAGIGVSAIVFFKRQHTTLTEGAVSVDVAGGNGQVLDYERYVPGGQLVMLSPPRPDGKLQVITSEFPTADFNGVDVSFDAKQIVFSMKRDPDDHYHLYTARIDDPGGGFEIHQLSNGPQDDIHPIYIPGGRVAFVTNQMYSEMGARSDEYNHGRGVTQLATMSLDGGEADRRLTSQNLSHSVAPFARFDGRIGYSRWEHLGVVNDVKLFAANPDGTQMVALAGQHAKPANSLFSVREIEPNVMIGIGTDRERTIHAGALVKIDARNQADEVCMDAKVLDKVGHACVDEENARYEVLTPEVPTSRDASPVGRYREPSPLPDGRILVSWAGGPVNDLSEQSVTPPDFGVYVFDPATKKNLLVYNDRQTWDLGALAVTPRTEPPLVRDILGPNVDPNAPVRIGSVDVRRTSLTDVVKGAQFGDEGVPLGEALKEAVKVRIIEGFSSEGAKGVTMFGLTMDDGAAILGEADVQPDGSWLAQIPPYIPVHLQPIDKYGMSIRNQRLWIQGMPGEDRRCVGCHESRSAAGAPSTGQNPTVAEQREQLFLAKIEDRLELPWALTKEHTLTTPPKIVIQNILNDKCVKCHSGQEGDPFAGRSYTMTGGVRGSGESQTFTIPYLDLSEDPIAVVYDRKAASYPKSYVSLFFPASLETGAGTLERAGDLPPRWAIPGSARESALIAKLNVRAPDGALAFGEAMHPEDKGVTLTDADRLVLIQSIDLGGQFYARQNTGFVRYLLDPMSAGERY